MITGVLGNLVPQEEAVESYEAEAEEKGLSTTPKQYAIEGEDQDIEAKEGEDAEEQTEEHVERQVEENNPEWGHGEEATTVMEEEEDVQFITPPPAI